MTKLTKEDALKALNCLLEDFAMLDDGSWQPDSDSIWCSVENVKLVRNYLNQPSKIEIPIEECDLETFKEIVYENRTLKWTFHDQNTNAVDIEFMSIDEHDQRGA